MVSKNKKDFSMITDTDDTTNISSVEIKNISSLIGSLLDSFITNKKI
jgi:hypothetical protein